MNTSIVVISFNPDDKTKHQYTPETNLDGVATKVSPQILFSCPFIDDVHQEKLISDAVIMFYARLPRHRISMNFKYGFVTKLIECLTSLPDGYYKIIKWTASGSEPKEYELVHDTFKMEG